MGRHNSFWNDERDELLKKYWNEITEYGTKLTLQVIANRICQETNHHVTVTPSCLSQRAELLDLPRRRAGRPVQLAHLDRPLTGISASGYFEHEAQRRGLSVAQLISRIMQVVKKDKMVNAILDDEDEIKPVEVSEAPSLVS